MRKLTDALAGYLADGYRFEKIEVSPGAERQNLPVFLIHGWGVRAASMRALGNALARDGMTVYNYDYPSSRSTIGEHAAIFLALYRRLLDEKHITRKVRFVTHSMGGLLLRAALARMCEAECRNIDAMVMLGPPNRGSILAAPGANPLVRRVNASLGDMTTDENSFVNTLPPPVFLPPVGIVAGRFDGKVALDNTSLPDGQPFERLVVDCTHPGLRDPRHTLEPIRRFLLRKTFA